LWKVTEVVDWENLKVPLIVAGGICMLLVPIILLDAWEDYRVATCSGVKVPLGVSTCLCNYSGGGGFSVVYCGFRDGSAVIYVQDAGYYMYISRREVFWDPRGLCGWRAVAFSEDGLLLKPLEGEQ